MPTCENCGMEFAEIVGLSYFTGKQKKTKVYMPVMQACPVCGHIQQTGVVETDG